MDDLRDLVEERWRLCAVEGSDGETVLSEYVFHNGSARRLGDFRRAWKEAATAASLPGRWFHDFRRSAVRNLVNSGTSTKVSMEITGHKTASVFRRYHIVTETEKAEALKRTFARGHRNARRVVPLSSRQEEG